MTHIAAGVFIAMAIGIFLYYAETDIPLAQVQARCADHRGVQAIHEPPFSVLATHAALVICRDGTLKDLK